MLVELVIVCWFVIFRLNNSFGLCQACTHAEINTLMTCDCYIHVVYSPFSILLHCPFELTCHDHIDTETWTCLCCAVSCTVTCVSCYVIHIWCFKKKWSAKKKTWFGVVICHVCYSYLTDLKACMLIWISALMICHDCDPCIHWNSCFMLACFCHPCLSM